MFALWSGEESGEQKVVRCHLFGSVQLQTSHLWFRVSNRSKGSRAPVWLENIVRLVSGRLSAEVRETTKAKQL
jgi:hypothetical protein